MICFLTFKIEVDVSVTVAESIECVTPVQTSVSHARLLDKDIGLILREM